MTASTAGARTEPGTAGGSAVTQADWDRAIALIQAAAPVTLACHVSPDGDALGSMLAFGLALATTGRKVIASFGDASFVVPQTLRFLPGQELLVEPAACPAQPDVMITFDASARERLGLLGPSADQARELIVIDHHRSNTRFGSLHLVDPAAAATAVLVEELLHRMGLPITRDVATCLYVALVSDTGSFRYSVTAPATHAMAGRLIAAGVRPDEVATQLWDSMRFDFLKVLGLALDRITLEPSEAAGQGLVWTYVTRQDRLPYGLPYDEVEAVIDIVRRVSEADVAVVLKQDDAGLWKVSARSRGAVDVGRACTALGGGGHPRAAGFSSALAPEDTIAAFRRQLVPGREPPA